MPKCSPLISVRRRLSAVFRRFCFTVPIIIAITIGGASEAKNAFALLHLISFEAANRAPGKAASYQIFEIREINTFDYN
jgi:hypothetical protein